jgi:hypothetical protein
MSELDKLIEDIRDEFEEFYAFATKEIAFKTAFKKARKSSVSLSKKFKEYRKLSLLATQNKKGE